VSDPGDTPKRYKTPVVFNRPVVFGEDVEFHGETFFYGNVRHFGVQDFNKKNTFWNRLIFLFKGR